jgi:hypothetical protein
MPLRQKTQDAKQLGPSPYARSHMPVASPYARRPHMPVLGGNVATLLGIEAATA